MMMFYAPGRISMDNLKKVAKEFGDTISGEQRPITREAKVSLREMNVHVFNASVFTGMKA